MKLIRSPYREKFSRLIRKSVELIKSVFLPTDAQLKWSGWAIIFSLLVLTLYTVVRYLPTLGPGVCILYLLFYFGIYSLFGLGAELGIALINKIPKFFRFVLVLSFFLLTDLFPGPFNARLILAIYIIFFAALIGGSLYNLRKYYFLGLSLSGKIQTYIVLGIGVVLFGLGVYSMFLFNKKVAKPENAAMKTEVLPTPVQTTDLSLPGSFKVLSLTYGSGKDKHRVEYRDSATMITDSVDASAFIGNWKKFHGKMRTRYWGFNEKSLPLNGRIWYPDGKGPFPLVLIVHGNHSSKDFSDPGYAYLGNHLASRGYILVSVDENFINGSWANMFNHLEEETDGRAWLLLKHLEYWRKWNNEKDNPFYKLVDLNNISLIGHSRGGEAVAVAAMFNQLPFYPDDATISFDFGFKIRSIISIAPVDGQYKPGDIGTFFDNVSYFTIHGSYDMDVTSFSGSRQFQRIHFTDSNEYFFKAGLYIYGANHGQFNTVWGRKDLGYPGIHLYNTRAIMDPMDQRKIAKFYFTAFLDATLRGKTEYVRFFQDYRTGRDWLPATIYLNQFEDSKTKYLCSFEEDLDVTTGTLSEINISSENLTIWREELIPLKWGKQDTRGVYLGWNLGETDSVPGKYLIHSKTNIDADSSSFLIFALADANEPSNPKDEKDTSSKSDTLLPETSDTLLLKKKKDEEKEKKNKEDEIRKPIDFSITLTDKNGQKATLPLSRYSYLQPQLESFIMKADFLSKEKKSEIVFQHFRLAIEIFVEENSKLDPGQIRSIEFIFNKNHDGVIVLDNLGIGTNY